MFPQVLSYVEYMLTSVGGSTAFLREVVGPIGTLGNLYPALREKAGLLLDQSLKVAGPLVRGKALSDCKLHRETVKALNVFHTPAM